MKPATPPSSSCGSGGSRVVDETRSLNSSLFDDDYVENRNGDRVGDQAFSLKTPRKNIARPQSLQPVTPMTATKGDEGMRTLLRSESNESDFKLSEITPVRRPAADQNLVTPSDEKCIHSKVNRVLFPSVENTNEFGKRKLFQSSIEEQEHKKHPRLRGGLPSTPTKQIITSSIINKCHNEEYNKFSSDEESEGYISNKNVPNPFETDNEINEKIIRERKQQLLAENPDIESTVTYLNKEGEVAKVKVLSVEEKEKFKPKRLFKDDI